MEEYNVAVEPMLTSNLNELTGAFSSNVSLVVAIFERYGIRTCRQSRFNTVFTIQAEGR